jgi:predicted AAA+ superfamily ATPase
VDLRLVDRQLKPVVEELMGDLRVVVVNGPRQSGKTTLLRQLHAVSGGSFYTLDQPEVFQFARDDPTGFIADAPLPAYIDEVQRGGDDLVRAVKLAVDADPRPGSFVLSGSSRFLTIPTLSESLAGRAAVVELWPLSVAERAGATPYLVDRLLTDHRSLRSLPDSPLTRMEYLELACAGGFPRTPPRKIGARQGELVQRLSDDRRATRHPRHRANPPSRRDPPDADPARRAHRADGEDLGPRRDLGHGSEHGDQIPVAARTGLPDPLAAGVSNNLTSRATRTPKMHFVDTGVAARLLNRSPRSLAQPGTAEAGSLFESFVVGELVKQSALAESGVQMFHFRDRDGGEVDCVLETPDRRILGIEVKLSMSVNEADFRHLRAMRDRQGDQFVCGVFFYCGRHALPFGDRLLALPASSLWAGEPVPESLP